MREKFNVVSLILLLLVRGETGSSRPLLAVRLDWLLLLEVEVLQIDQHLIVLMVLSSCNSHPWLPLSAFAHVQ
jgi:hypothetical protein